MTALALPHGLESLETLITLARRILARAGVLPADRDDVAQEVAIVVFRRWPTYRPDLGTPAAWLGGIIRHEVRNWCRRRRKVPGDVVADLIEVPVEDDVEDAIHAQELLAALPATERRVLLLSAAGHTFREVAACEGISPSTALARLDRGLAALALHQKGPAS